MMEFLLGFIGALLGGAAGAYLPQILRAVRSLRHDDAPLKTDSAPPDEAEQKRQKREQEQWSALMGYAGGATANERTE